MTKWSTNEVLVCLGFGGPVGDHTHTQTNPNQRYLSKNEEQRKERADGVRGLYVKGA